MSPLPRRALPFLLLLAAGCVAPAAPASDAGVPLPIRVATWNLRQLGADGGNGARHAPLLASLSADLATVQEVASEPAFADLSQRLDGFSGVLGPLAATAGDLRQGFLWRSSKLAVRDVTPLFEDQPLLFPRPALQATVDVLEPGADSPRATFFVVALHLKAGARAADEDKRVQALKLVEARVRELDPSGSGVPVLVLGDFNEAPTDARAGEAFAPFTSEPGRYRLLSEGFADAGIVTYLPRSLVFDHLVATAALDGARDGGLPSVPRLDQEDPAYVGEVSDHLPVLLDLGFGRP